MVKKAGGVLLPPLVLEHSGGKSLSAQLAGAIRDLILAGKLRAGDRLPASRTIAVELGISRTTVVEAFDRLLAEALITSRTGAGTYVSEELAGHSVDKPAAHDPQASFSPRVSVALSQRSPSFLERPEHVPRAFTTALPAFDAFPMALWSRHVARHWRAGRESVLGYGESQGFMPLRRAIAAHLRASRGITCEADEIFVVNGAQHGFQLISSLLLDPGDAVWFENPGAIGVRNCFLAAGARLVPVPVDAEGLVVEEGLRQAPSFRLAFVTPSHQQPLGSTMSLRRRLALLAAAESSHAWIVEDDYDGEFCYRGRPPPTLRSIDVSGRVIYVGTFSKTLFPALRLGYVLVPPALLDTFRRVMASFSPGVPSSSQAIVAGFIDEGHFSSHIRRMRKLYAERHDALLNAGGRRLAGLLEIAPTDTGLHTVARLLYPAAEADIAKRALARQITLSPLGRFCISPIPTQGFVLGFSGVKPEEIRRGVDVLAEVLRPT